MNVTLTDPFCLLYSTPVLSGLDGGILKIDNGRLKVLAAANLDSYALLPLTVKLSTCCQMPIN